MAAPFLFTLRHRGYQVACAILLLGTILVLFGVISPGWYSVETDKVQFYSHLWIRCRQGLRGCHFLGTSETEGFQKATQAFALLGFFGLVTSCFVAVYFNFLTENKRHHRVLEVTILVSGGLSFLAGIIFVAGNPDYVAAREAADPTLKVTSSYGLALTFVGAILGLAAGVVTWVFNRPLDIPSDERSLSGLRQSDPVDRLHREAGGRGRGRRGGGGGGDGEDDDHEFGFTNPALQMADEEPGPRPEGEGNEAGEGQGQVRPPSYRNFDPRRAPAHVSRLVEPDVHRQNGYPPSMEEEAPTAGHPANSIDRHPYHHHHQQQQQQLQYQQQLGASPTNIHQRPAAVDHHHHHHPHHDHHHHPDPTPAEGYRGGRDRDPYLDSHIDLDPCISPPPSAPPPRPRPHPGAGLPRRRPSSEEEGEGLQRERGQGRARERRDDVDGHSLSSPPPFSRWTSSDADSSADSARREKRNNEINAASSAISQQRRPRPRSEGRGEINTATTTTSGGDHGVDAAGGRLGGGGRGGGDRRDWQRGQQQQISSRLRSEGDDDDDDDDNNNNIDNDNNNNGPRAAGRREALGADRRGGQRGDQQQRYSRAHPPGAQQPGGERRTEEAADDRLPQPPYPAAPYPDSGAPPRSLHRHHHHRPYEEDESTRVSSSSSLQSRSGNDTPGPRQRPRPGSRGPANGAASPVASAGLAPGERPGLSLSSRPDGRRTAGDEGRGARDGREEGAAEEDPYADGDLGEPTPNYRQAAVKTWLKGGRGGGGWGGAGGRGTEGRTEEGGGRPARKGSGERKVAADDRYADDAHIYVNVSPGYERRYPSAAASSSFPPQSLPPSDHHLHHHHRPVPPHDGRYDNDGSSGSGEAPGLYQDPRRGQANASDRNASVSENARHGRANPSDARNAPGSQDTRRQNDDGRGGGNAPAPAEVRGGRGYYGNDAMRETSPHDSHAGGRRYHVSDPADDGRERAARGREHPRRTNDYANAIGDPDRDYSGNGRAEVDGVRGNGGSANDYVNVRRGSDSTTTFPGRREDAYGERPGSGTEAIRAGRQNSRGSDARLGPGLRGKLYGEESGRVLRLSSGGDVTETDIDSVDDSFPRPPPMQSEI